jgi:hypothetical protein
LVALLALCTMAAQSGPITVLSRDGRRTLPTVEVQNHQMVGLDDLGNLLQLQIREDAAARAVTASFRNQTIVLTPDQPLVSASGRLVSLPAPLTRRSNRWLVPVEFINRALAPIYEPKLDFRPGSRLLVMGDLRVPRITAQYDDSPSAFRVTFEISPRANATVTQEQNRLLLRFEADAARSVNRHSRGRSKHHPDGPRPALRLVPHVAAHDARFGGRAHGRTDRRR